MQKKKIRLELRLQEKVTLKNVFIVCCRFRQEQKKIVMADFVASSEYIPNSQKKFKKIAFSTNANLIG